MFIQGSVFLKMYYKDARVYSDALEQACLAEIQYMQMPPYRKE